MKASLGLVTGLMFVVGAVIASGSIARADGTRVVGVVAISYTGTTINSLSSAIAVGKNSAAGTASISDTETAASAVGGGGVLTVTNANQANVSYQMDAEAATSLGTNSTAAVRSQQTRIDSNNGTSQAVTIIMP
jgi:hypothetical protein